MLAKRELRAGVKYGPDRKKHVLLRIEHLGNELELFVYVSRKGNVYLVVNKDRCPPFAPCF
jgi:hypothetical protein